MTVSQVFRIPRRVEGDVGIEIEAEGANLPRTGDYWNVEHDGSLRGEDLSQACEYVLQRPMSLSEAKEALAYLAHQYKENGAQVSSSPRCGVHVHVNCQQLSILQLYNFMTLYLIFEDVLVKWCGKTREGNLFCLRAKDAEYLIYVLSQALQDKEFRARFRTDELRYASMNVKALTDYGSLEFRAMEGTDDTDRIYQWASLLVSMREQAKTFTNPVEMILSSSGEGTDAFVNMCFPEEFVPLIKGVEGWEGMVVDGVRRAQEVAYAVDWEEIASFPKRKVGGLEVRPDWDEDWPPTDA